MFEPEYPALYRAADKLSIDQQKLFCNILILNLSCLTVGALISLANSKNTWLTVMQLVVLSASLCCSLCLSYFRYEKVWYSSRAIAESIKTMTWRYVTKASPYGGKAQDAKDEFLKVLKLTLKQNKDIAGKLDQYLTEPQITDWMNEARNSKLEDRKKVYLTKRVKEQHDWYAFKTTINKKSAGKYFCYLITSNILAVIFSVVKIFYPSFEYWPIDFFVTLAASLLAWMQAKKYSEHASSYALAAHEISLLRSEVGEVKNEKAFNEFVLNAEKAFSREHTQWIARKDKSL